MELSAPAADCHLTSLNISELVFGECYSTHLERALSLIQQGGPLVPAAWRSMIHVDVLVIYLAINQMLSLSASPDETELCGPSGAPTWSACP